MCRNNNIEIIINKDLISDTNITKMQETSRGVESSVSESIEIQFSDIPKLIISEDDGFDESKQNSDIDEDSHNKSSDTDDIEINNLIVKDKKKEKKKSKKFSRNNSSDISDKSSSNSASSLSVSKTSHRYKGMVIIKAIKHSWFSSLKRATTSRKKIANDSRKSQSAWDITSSSSTSSSSTSSSSTHRTIKSNSVSSYYRRTQLKDELGEVVAEMENMDTADDSKNHTRTKQMSIGRKKFNMDPKKGIEYLLEHGLLQATSEDVAAFLYKGEGLNKTAIGDYLGERNEFNEKVLRAFVELHDFTDLILVQALRQFLWSFRLPGEAQKIDRMMECFAQRYCQLNPNIFTNTDTCYVLSFAIIMLNTSLHNPSVKDKPTVEQFISMNRGINNGGDLPRELLESLYDSIKTEPFKIPEDDGNDLMHTFFNPDKEGWLWKQGGRYKSWKRRWFILNDNCLYYFEYTTDKEPRGIIPLENIQVREVSDRHKPHCFELYAAGTDFIKACKTDSEGKVVEGKHTVYRMSAATSEEKDEWIKCVRQSISHNPFYDMLAARKKKAQKTNAHHHHHHHHHARS